MSKLKSCVVNQDAEIKTFLNQKKKCDTLTCYQGVWKMFVVILLFWGWLYRM